VGLQRSLPDTAEFDQILLKNPAVLWGVIAALERIAAALCLLATFPFLLIAGIIIVILSRRSPLVSHKRVGQVGRELWVLKLRTMWGTTPSKGGPMSLVERVVAEPVPETKMAHDPRVTSRFAAFCRKYSVDEAPQLWQVVRGELALVGPRPLTSGEISQHYRSYASYVLRVRPGLTGLWQVRGRSRLSYRQRFKLDLFMIDHWSFSLYLMILMATIPGVLFGRDAR
jgi:exopolysaccharide production protein ExoY